MHCSPRGCLKQHFSLLPPPELQCLGHGLDLCCELIYKALLLPPLPPLILDVLASLPDPHALVLHPLHGAAVFPIMLSFFFSFLVTIPLDLWAPLLTPGSFPEKTNSGWVLWHVGLGLTQHAAACPSGALPPGLHVSTIQSNNSSDQLS